MWATARDDILHPPKPVKKKKPFAQPPLPPLGQPLRASFLAKSFANWEGHEDKKYFEVTKL